MLNLSPPSPSLAMWSMSHPGATLCPRSSMGKKPPGSHRHRWTGADHPSVTRALPLLITITGDNEVCEVQTLALAWQWDHNVVFNRRSTLDAALSQEHLPELQKNSVGFRAALLDSGPPE